MPLALRSAHVDRPAQPPPIAETDLDRLIKLIPVEVLSVYAAAVAAGGTSRAYALAAFVIGLALVPCVLVLDDRVTGARARWPQHAVRAACFVAWAGVLDRTWLPAAARAVAGIAVLGIPLVGAIATAVRARSP